MDFVCDLDGTVWLNGVAIPGVPQAIARARAAGHRFLFATNNSASTPSEIEQRLAAIGVQAVGEVVSSAAAAAGLVTVGERVFVIGGPGLRDAVATAGGTLTAIDPIDVVVVGRDTSLTFADLVRANSAIRSGARFVATNTDPTFATPTGLEPGGGVMVAAVALASGVEPEVAGKPHEPMAAAVKRALGGDLSHAVVVGDVPATDGLFAVELGVPFALVLSGTTTTAHGLRPRPRFIARDLVELMAEF